MNEKGFSMIELLMVVTIIGLVAAIAIPNYLGARKTANETRAIGYLRSWCPAQELYKRANGTYASADEDLVTQGYIGKGIGSDGTADDAAFTYSMQSDLSQAPQWSGRGIRRSIHTAVRSFYIDQTGVMRARVNGDDANAGDLPASQ